MNAAGTGNVADGTGAMVLYNASRLYRASLCYDIAGKVPVHVYKHRLRRVESMTSFLVLGGVEVLKRQGERPTTLGNPNPTPARPCVIRGPTTGDEHVLAIEARVNAFKAQLEECHGNTRRLKALLRTEEGTFFREHGRTHMPEHMPKQSWCVHCSCCVEVPRGNGGRAKYRRVGSRTNFRCRACLVALCATKPCFHEFHHLIHATTD